MMKEASTLAPELIVSGWLNTASPPTLEQLRGKVVVIEAFQMLCPGCVAHGLPQAQRIARTFAADEVVVLGLHSVFEHHQAQGTRMAIEAFLHEYRIPFPVAIDAPSADLGIPQTMAAYQLRGTPSLILIDRQGRYREQFFGEVSDLALGAHIMRLVGETDGELHRTKVAGDERQDSCDDSGCVVDLSAGGG